MATNECDHCPHPFGPHVMVATGSDGDPTLGGVMLCPEEGCQCFSTWDVPPYSKREDVRVPDDEELAQMRAWVQQEET